MTKVYERWPQEWDQIVRDEPDIEMCDGWIEQDDQDLECDREFDHPGKCAASFIHSGPIGAEKKILFMWEKQENG